MPVSCRHLFETALGWIGIAWSERGVTRLFLPEARARIERKLAALPGASPDTPSSDGEIARLVASIERYACGEAVEFSDAAVDLSGVDAFRLAIYAAARQLKFGETVTYGELAARAGHAGLARETGQALGANPVPLIVPCHRILAAGGRIGGFSAPGGSATKEKMLALEGVRLGPPPPAQQAFGF
jgi:methylated-DNA-[protein]-cysteine S-methyltransferase